MTINIARIIPSSLNTFKTNSLNRYTSVLIHLRQILYISTKSNYMIRIMVKTHVFRFYLKSTMKEEVLSTKVQVGKYQEKTQSEKDSHSKNRGGKKPK